VSFIFTRLSAFPSLSFNFGASLSVPRSPSGSSSKTFNGFPAVRVAPSGKNEPFFPSLFSFLLCFQTHPGINRQKVSSSLPPCQKTSPILHYSEITSVCLISRRRYLPKGCFPHYFFHSRFLPEVIEATRPLSPRPSVRPPSRPHAPMPHHSHRFTPRAHHNQSLLGRIPSK